MHSGNLPGFAALQYTRHSVPVLPKFREIGYAANAVHLKQPNFWVVSRNLANGAVPVITGALRL
mgnify:CR=1 FL=1